jgi:hypothetical protein
MSETRRSGLKSLLGIVSDRPLAFTRVRSPIPPNTRQNIRKVQGGISESAIFIIGQLKPHKKLMAPRSKKPRDGRPSWAIFPAAEDRFTVGDGPKGWTLTSSGDGFRILEILIQ